jgi:ribosome-binding ATPase YchF (GTP1/OBG family)
MPGCASLDGDFANVTTKLVIIGLPSSGKSTVFNALSRSTAETGSFGGDDEPNLATVKVPDERLDTLTELFQPQRRVPADVQYLDVRGIDKGVSEQGMSGQLLGHLSQGDALVHVVRAFEDEPTPHPEGSVDPARDIETMNLELAFSDLAVVDKRLQRVIQQLPKMKGAEREAYEREQRLMERLKAALEADTPLREIVDELEEEDRKTLRGFGLLTIKPMLVLVNLGETQLGETGEALIARRRRRWTGRKDRDGNRPARTR